VCKCDGTRAVIRETPGERDGEVVHEQILRLLDDLRGEILEARADDVLGQLLADGPVRRYVR
jgi:hypothetical protein